MLPLEYVNMQEDHCVWKTGVHCLSVFTYSKGYSKKTNISKYRSIYHSIIGIPHSEYWSLFYLPMHTKFVPTVPWVDFQKGADS